MSKLLNYAIYSICVLLDPSPPVIENVFQNMQIFGRRPSTEKVH